MSIPPFPFVSREYCVGSEAQGLGPAESCVACKNSPTTISFFIVP